MSAAARYDAIVIGAGHNGLTAAFFLARAGLATLVLERREIVGGSCVTEEVDPVLAPGVRCSTTSYIASMLRPEVIRAMDLPAHGLRMIPCEPAVQAVLPGRRVVPWWTDRARLCAELQRCAPGDAGAFVEVDDALKRVARFLQPYFLEPPPDVHATGLARLRELVRLARRMRGIRGADITLLVELLTGSLADFVAARFRHEETRALLLANSLYGKHGGPFQPGTAIGLLFHLLGGGERDTQGYYGHVVGGMGAITQAMAAACRGAGVKIRCEAPVAQILERSGKVRGVVLEDGTEIGASLVVSNADPRRTFLGLLAPDALDEDFRRRVAAIRMAGPCAKVNFVLAEAPRVEGMPADADPGQRALFTLVPSYPQAERGYASAAGGELPEVLWVDCVVPTNVDDTLAPARRHVLTCFVQYVPYRLASGDWDQMRELLGNHVQARIAEFAPNVPGAVIARRVFTPLDLERVFGLTEGNIFHGDPGLGQLFFMRPLPGWAHYRTPITGLYLCGAGTHPGGGVTGAPGYNAAHRILRERRHWR